MRAKFGRVPTAVSKKVSFYFISRHLPQFLYSFLSVSTHFHVPITKHSSAFLSTCPNSLCLPHLLIFLSGRLKLLCDRAVLIMFLYVLFQLSRSAEGVHVLHVQSALHKQLNGDPRVSHRAGDCTRTSDGCQLPRLLDGDHHHRSGLAERCWSFKEPLSEEY